MARARRRSTAGQRNARPMGSTGAAFAPSPGRPDVLDCQTPHTNEKQLRVHLLADNVVRLLMAQAASNADMDPHGLSFKHTVQLWTQWIARGLSATKDCGRSFRWRWRRPNASCAPRRRFGEACRRKSDGGPAPAAFQPHGCRADSKMRCEPETWCGNTLRHCEPSALFVKHKRLHRSAIGGSRTTRSRGGSFCAAAAPRHPRKSATFRSWRRNRRPGCLPPHGRSSCSGNWRAGPPQHFPVQVGQHLLYRQEQAVRVDAVKADCCAEPRPALCSRSHSIKSPTSALRQIHAGKRLKPDNADAASSSPAIPRT